MSGAAQVDSPGRRPVVAEALAVALLFAVVGGLGVGALRYTSAQSAKRAAVEQALGQADQLAAAWSAQGEAGLASPAEGTVALHVVLDGGLDPELDFQLKPRVVLDQVLDETARPADPAKLRSRLLVSNGVFATRLGRKRALAVKDRVEAAEQGDTWLVAASSPIVDEAGAYSGFVRVTRRAAPPSDPVPTWRFLFAILLAAGLCAGALRFTAWKRVRVIGAVAASLPVLVALGLSSATLTLVLFAGAAVVGFGVTPSFAALLRGLRAQPGTYAYVAPAMLGMAVLVFLPFAMGIALSFFNSDGTAFVGLQNFGDLLVPSEHETVTFWWTLFITILWTASNVILHVSIGLSLALVLNRPNLRGRWAYRVLLIVPWAVPNYITALIWKWMFNTQYGAVNALLAVFDIGAVDWLGNDVATNFIANLVTNTWLGFPFMMVVSLGALQAIPGSLYEAAKIDGANRWQQFRHVTVPLLKPALVPAIILGTIWTFNMFNVIYLVSGGGPAGQTNILITQAYHAFKVQEQYGLAAAYSLLIFVILYLYGALTNRVTRASEGAFE